MTVKDLAEMFPERFNNKTNGVTPRRWLLLANPRWPAPSPRPSAMAGSPTSRSCGNSSRSPTTRAFATPSARPSARPKCSSPTGSNPPPARSVDPDTHFRLPDQAHPRIQAATAQRAAHRRALQPAAGKPGPGDAAAHLLLRRQGRAAYHLAKLIIKFINNLAGTIDGDPGGARPAQGPVPARVLRAPWPSG